MSRKVSSMYQALLVVVIFFSFGCESEGGKSVRESVDSQNSLVNKEDVLLKVNGICGENRSYGLLESNLIDRPDGLSEIKQIIFRENGTYLETSETFKITQKGKLLFNFSERSETVKNGNWNISRDGLKIDDGILNYLDGNTSFVLTNSRNNGKTITFRRIEKISEQFIPQEMGCVNRAEILSKSTTGKFSVKMVDSSQGLVRNTLSQGDLAVLFGGIESMNNGTPVYCSRFGFSSFCEMTVQLNLDMKGTLTFQDSKSQNMVIRVTGKRNDNAVELMTESGKLIRLIPSPEYSGFFIEDTEEFLSE